MNVAIFVTDAGASGPRTVEHRYRDLQAAITKYKQEEMMASKPMNEARLAEIQTEAMMQQAIHRDMGIYETPLYAEVIELLTEVKRGRESEAAVVEELRTVLDAIESLLVDNERLRAEHEQKENRDGE